jgi:hypothetical protein
MKYSDFKIHLGEIMSGDKKVPENKKLKPIILQCLREVAIRCEPLCLLSDNVENDILTVVEDELFIRVPHLSQKDSDKIDMDETLVYAVSYLVASKISKNATIVKYTKEADEIINDYQWNRYRDIQSGKLDLKKSMSENSLNIHGYKNIYVSKIKTIKGYVYVFDEKFIELLGLYLEGNALKLSRSYKDNIDKYLEYQYEDREEINEVYETLNKILGEKR